MSSPLSLNNLPPDTQNKIASFLDVWSRQSLAATCTTWATLEKPTSQFIHQTVHLFDNNPPHLALATLVSHKFLSPTLPAAARFLYEARVRGISNDSIATYILNPGDKDRESRQARSLALLGRFLDHFNFTGETPVKALRHFLFRFEIPPSHTQTALVLKRVANQYMKCQRGVWRPPPGGSGTSGGGSGIGSDRSATASSAAAANVPTMLPTSTTCWSGNGLVTFELTTTTTTTSSSSGSSNKDTNHAIHRGNSGVRQELSSLSSTSVTHPTVPSLTSITPLKNTSTTTRSFLTTSHIVTDLDAATAEALACAAAVHIAREYDALEMQEQQQGAGGGTGGGTGGDLPSGTSSSHASHSRLSITSPLSPSSSSSLSFPSPSSSYSSPPPYSPYPAVVVQPPSSPSFSHSPPEGTWTVASSSSSSSSGKVNFLIHNFDIRLVEDPETIYLVFMSLIVLDQDLRHVAVTQKITREEFAERCMSTRGMELFPLGFWRGCYAELVETPLPVRRGGPRRVSSYGRGGENGSYNHGNDAGGFLEGVMGVVGYMSRLLVGNGEEEE